MKLKFPIFYAPDGGATGTIEAPGVSVPVIESAAPVVEDVNIQSGGIEHIVDDAPEFGVKSAKDILGEDPEETMEAADKAMGKEARERGPDGKFLPKGVKKAPAPAVAQAKPAPKPVAKPEPVIAKVKIGEDEKTPEEWQAEMKALKEKAEAAAKPPEPKPDPKQTAQDEADEARAISEQRQKFIKSEINRPDDIDEKFHDRILAGGPDGLKAVKELRARDKAEQREWTANGVNALLKNLREELAPILEREKTISDYNESNAIMANTPELKAHPKGLETYRTTKNNFETAFQTIQGKGDSATPAEKAWALQYGAATPEDRKGAIIAAAKAELAKQPIPAKPNGTNGTPPPKPPLRITTPQRADRPGGGVATPKAGSKDSQALAEMEAHGY